MADKKPAAKAAPKKSKKSKSAATLYTVSGSSIQRKNKYCPKCGPGIFLGVHETRVVCGKCKYVEYRKR